MSLSQTHIHETGSSHITVHRRHHHHHIVSLPIEWFCLDDSMRGAWCAHQLTHTGRFVYYIRAKLQLKVQKQMKMTNKALSCILSTSPPISSPASHRLTYRMNNIWNKEYYRKHLHINNNCHGSQRSSRFAQSEPVFIPSVFRCWFGNRNFAPPIYSWQ